MDFLNCLEKEEAEKATKEKLAKFSAMYGGDTESTEEEPEGESDESGEYEVEDVEIPDWSSSEEGDDDELSAEEDEGTKILTSSHNLQMRVLFLEWHTWKAVKYWLKSLLQQQLANIRRIFIN